nr:hypothetical protein [Tanacetum cinerariifolium]
MEKTNPFIKSLDREPSCFEGELEFVMLFRKEELEEGIEEELEEEEEKDNLEYFNTFPTREELEYHEYLLKNPRPSWIRAKIRKGNLNNIKIPRMIGGMVLGKLFVKNSKLISDKEEGNVMFEKGVERVTFKMPHKMESFKDIEDLNTDNIPPFFITIKWDEEKGE